MLQNTTWLSPKITSTFETEAMIYNKDQFLDSIVAIRYIEQQSPQHFF